jgi:hypothetical protein
MRFVKVRVTHERAIWKREPRPPLTKQQQDKLISLKPEEAKKLPTEEKRLWFYNEMQKIREEAREERMVLLIERTSFLRDSFEQFHTTTDLDLRGKLNIHFIDELAEDAGGVIREWFSIITEELFKPSLKLFKKANTKELSFIFNENVEGEEIIVRYAEFAGKVFAKAMFERIPIKCYLNKTILNQILGIPLNIQDLKYFDQELWQSIDHITNKGTKGLDLTFTAGKIELKSNRKAIIVIDKNKNEFCKLFADYLMTKSISLRLQSFLNGFYSLIPRELVSVLDSDELELFFCGDSAIDVEDWKSNTTYKDFYNKNHQIIKWFWEIILSLNDEERRKMLQFCTGSTRVPVEGFKGLLSNNSKVCNFCIEPKEFTGAETSFIVAHTCFNRIELPEYPEKQIMEKNLKQIINNPQCFNFTFK